jgi:predicted metalloprotease with PDZ domain
MTRRRSRSLALVVPLLLAVDPPAIAADAPTPPAPTRRVTDVPRAVRERFGLDPFYKKYLETKGFPILGSEKVSDEALIEAADIVDHMLDGRDDVREVMIRNKVRLVVMAPTEMTTDVPEQRDMTPKAYWDRRARGLGGSRRRPVASCAEENLLNLEGDRYRDENILVHEFAHTIHGTGLRDVDPAFNGRLRDAYRKAMDKGLWKNTYAATNPGEYWAEGVQSYFDTNAPSGGVHNEIDTREELADYDPDLFKLINEAFKGSEWRYVRYDERNPKAGTAREPVIYTVRLTSPETHVAEVEATLPTGGRESVELMMPAWSPGFYRVEDSARQVEGLAAHAPDGTSLGVEQPRKNRWRVRTDGVPSVVVSYRLSCRQRSVTTNWVGDDLAVLNGPATFVTPAGGASRPHEVRIELPSKWARVVTALDPAPDGLPNHYRAEDYDTLADSPILAGNPSLHEFEVGGSTHVLADAGDLGAWDGRRAAGDLGKLARENRRFWGSLPFKRYYFLNVFRPGAGGLEHKDSTLLTSRASAQATPREYLSWLRFVSHEYFHAFNVKRLRPVELGPFDYEHPPATASLWVSEGLTTYFGDLIVARAGLGTAQDFLSALSSFIGRLQDSPGRLIQTLEESSLDVWGSGTSGVGRERDTQLSYYDKGPVVGFLLDAHIRRATEGRKSLDDVMRLAYERYSGDRGFTPGQFREVAEEVAGVDLEDWFRRAVSSTEELDYAEALDWFGLRFAPPEGAAKSWELEVRPDVTEIQRVHLQEWLRPSGGPARPG